MNDSILIDDFQTLVNNLAKRSQETPQAGTKKGDVAAEVNDHVAAEGSHQVMSEVRKELAAVRDQVAAKEMANAREMNVMRRELAALKDQVASSQGTHQAITELKTELADLKDLIYTQSDKDDFFTDVKSGMAELKALIYANFGVEDKATTKMREELAETKTQISALEHTSLEQDNRIFARSMESEQVVMDMRMVLRGMGDRVETLEERAEEHSAKIAGQDRENCGYDLEMARLKGVVLENGDEVARLKIKVAGVEEEMGVQKRELDGLGESVTRERLMARLREEGVFD